MLSDTAPPDRADTVERLAPGRVDQCYTVAQLARPRLTLDAWRAHCAKCLAAREGTSGIREDVLTAIDAHGYVRGLCSYAVVEAPAGTALRVDIFFVAHPFCPHVIAAGIFDQLEAVALREGCTAIQVDDQSAGPFVLRLAEGRALPIQYEPPRR